VDYSFKLKVTNSTIADYKVELIVAGTCILVMVGIALALAIRHHLVHQSYRELVEEESRENIELGAKAEVQKGRLEERVE
jgi:VIT1/CCC1 family predicted Fe2+/Mn2+ transporter